MNKDTRIGIIGAGISGVTAAYYLKEKGYTDVTILEKENYVGGKIKTIFADGFPCNLGTILTSSTKESDIFKFIQKYNIKYVTNPTSMLLYHKKAFLPWNFDPTCYLPQIRAFLNSWKSLDNIYMPLDKACKKLNTPLVLNLANILTASAYSVDGNFVNVPVAIAVPLIKEFCGTTVNIYCPEGLQIIVDKIVEHEKLNVNLNCTVNTITRKNSAQIETSKGTFEFDKIILTTPNASMLSFLDITKEEKEVFSKVVYTEIRSYVCKLSGVPKTQYTPLISYVHNYNKNKMDRLICLFQCTTEKKSNIFYVGALSQTKLTLEDQFKLLEEDLNESGISVVKYYTGATWLHFHRFEEKDYLDGITNKLEALQGQNNTYFSSELNSSSAVNACIKHAKKLVNTYF